ncbi:MAG: hypothetical protein ABSG85_01685 [Spirochaetia bacterium]|jgi:hypothetical protein
MGWAVLLSALIMVFLYDVLDIMTPRMRGKWRKHPEGDTAQEGEIDWPLRG